MTGCRTQQHRWIAAAVAVMLLASASAPHHHTDRLQELREYLGDAPTTPYHEVACRTTRESHWHADRVLAPEPCLACLLQHLTGIKVQAPTQANLETVEVLYAVPSRNPVGGFQSAPASRGPPALL